MSQSESAEQLLLMRLVLQANDCAISARNAARAIVRWSMAKGGPLYRQ